MGATRRTFDSNDDAGIMQFNTLAQQAVQSGMWLSVSVEMPIGGLVVFEYEPNPAYEPGMFREPPIDTDRTRVL